VFTWADGSRYEGEFANDKMNGQGIMVYADGSSYSGEWKDDKKHGEAVVKGVDGKELSTVYEEGDCIYSEDFSSQ
jgi:hypothetical protein